jgi:hypothetical protein
VVTKAKYRSRLNAVPELRIQLFSIKPNMKKICKTGKTTLCIKNCNYVAY